MRPVIARQPVQSIIYLRQQFGAFACGNDDIDTYLHDRAQAEQALSLCQVYVMADDALRVWAYGTLSPISVRIESELLKAVGLTQAPYKTIGGYLLGRLGVDQALQKLVQARIPAVPHPYLREGARVRITRGPLSDVEGVLVRTRLTKGLLVLSVNMLQRSVAVEVDCTLVTPA